MSWNTGRLTHSGRQSGEGELVMLLHGFPAYHKTWEEYLEPLSQHFQVVAPDLRGYYGSDKPHGVANYRIDELLEDIARLVRHLGHSKVRLVGHDWGGALTWAAAALRPNLVSHASIINCPHPEAMSYHLLRNPRQRKRSWYIFFFQLPWIPEYLMRRRSRRFIRVCFGSGFSREELDDYEQAFLRPGVATAAVNYYRAAARGLFNRRKMPKIQCPVKVYWGDRDPALGPELIEGHQRYCDGPFELKRFPEAGHWSVNQSAPEIIPDLIEFLQD